jgi:serine-type D-Ala-D-Ala carboxypeptidase (penicillin-binding protein 5/6)
MNADIHRRVFWLVERMERRQMKNWVVFAVLISIFFAATSGFTADSLTVNASAAVLINADTGEVLYSKNSDSTMIPASTTKIMTAIIAIENGDLAKKVKVSPRAAAKPGSSMHLQAGEAQTLRDLLYGLLLPSGNDAATAIAECIAGSEEKFARMMTAKARELGMENTCFKNASGLPAAGHYTTAYDMALLADYALKNPTFAEIVQTKSASVPGSRSKVHRSLINHNKLLWQYPYTTGIKTGYTRRAGPCLVASASQNGITLVSVILKSDTMYNDSINLFDYGFQSISGVLNNDSTNESPSQADLIYCP